MEAEILIKTGDKEAGFAAAKKLAESQPESSATQLWYSKIAQQMDNLDVAVQALLDSLKNNPSNPDKWIRLIGLYAEQEKIEEIEGVIREAHLSCDAEFLPILTGKYYELLSRWQSAESIYLKAYEGKESRLTVARRLADFYLLWSSKDEANKDKAAIYINHILRAANEGKAKSGDRNVAWARHKAAQLLYLEKDYQQSLRAERLLRETDADYVMNDAESELLTDILIARADPRSLMQAKNLLTRLREEDRIPMKSALQLVHILSQTNQWKESKALLLDLIAKYPSNSVVWITYIDLLIDHEEFTSAENRIKRLQSLDPKNPSLVQLSTRLAAEQGDQAKLDRMLRSLVPNLRGGLNANQLNNVLSVAQLATQYGSYELAEQLYDAYAKRVPGGEFQIARFLAYHGDCERALTLMKRLYTDQTDDVVQLANRMLSARRDEIGDTFDERVDRLIDASLREDPESVTRLLARAESYETQGKYEQSIAAYDQLIKRDDMSRKLRAAAMNNLGFQLALLNRRVDEAEQLVTQAMGTFGPVEDMLDTRAVVRMVQKKYDLAIEDMELAVSVSRDPIKYFHLAKAYALAGKGPAALEAWEKSQTLGFEKEALPPLEKATFEQVLQQIKSFENQSAKL